MKRIFILFFALISLNLSAQKIAFIDSEFILGKIPAYTEAQKQLEELSAKWQQRIEQAVAEINQARKQYRAEEALYSEDMKKRKEDELIAKERAIQELQKKYFGPEGELFKKRQELIAPIQDDLFNAVKSVADEGNYGIILDKSSGVNIIYGQARYDVSTDVLKLMGN
jgi:outer membrane protein